MSAYSLRYGAFKPGHMSPGNMYPGRATCIPIVYRYTLYVDGCRRIHVARPGYL